MSLEIFAVRGIGEVTVGDDLATLLLEHLDRPLLAGDVVVVTSKVVSKAAGLVTHGSRTDLLADQTDRLVARRGATSIVRTKHGLTMAAAGIDASNTRQGTAVPLPPDPDADARALRARIALLSGVEVAVIVSDTSGRAWRTGQTDIAVGAAGILPLVPLAGEQDTHGNTLAVTAPAVADEVAAAADLVKGKTAGCPFAVVRGLPARWTDTPGETGAAALIRPEGSDMFGLGAVEAVRTAVRRETPVRGFPAAEPEALDALVADATHEASSAHVEVSADRVEVVAAADAGPREWGEAGALAERLRTLATAFGLDVVVTLRCG